MKEFFIKIVEDHGLKYDLTPCDIDGTEFKSDETQKAYIAMHFAVELMKKKFAILVTK